MLFVIHVILLDKQGQKDLIDEAVKLYKQHLFLHEPILRYSYLKT